MLTMELFIKYGIMTISWNKNSMSRPLKVLGCASSFLLKVFLQLLLYVSKITRLTDLHFSTISKLKGTGSLEPELSSTTAAYLISRMAQWLMGRCPAQCGCAAPGATHTLAAWNQMAPGLIALRRLPGNLKWGASFLEFSICSFLTSVDLESWTEVTEIATTHRETPS